jgi:hypothetical protein
MTKKPCEVCLKQGLINMDAEFHHPDHRNPWKGNWLCKKHHEAEDTRLDRERKK